MSGPHERRPRAGSAANSAVDGVSGASFEVGQGKWLGSAEVYDSEGRFAGGGHDARALTRSLDGRTIEVDVSFVGPFRMSGRYTIADRGDHRVYGGPLNYGYAEALGEGLIDANNYWPDIGFSQRFLLMVLPGGETQLSLALLSRGEKQVYTVVGEYSRDYGTGPKFSPGSAHDLRDDPHVGRGSAVLDRPGSWSGDLTLLDAEGAETGATPYREQVQADRDRRMLDVSLANTGFTDNAEICLTTNGWHRWTGPIAADGGDLRRKPAANDNADRPLDQIVGSESVWGGRAVSGNLIFCGLGLRLWRREVAREDGSCKALLHTWYRGGARVGAAYGVLDFTPA